MNPMYPVYLYNDLLYNVIKWVHDNDRIDLVNITVGCDCSFCDLFGSSELPDIIKNTTAMITDYKLFLSFMNNIIDTIDVNHTTLFASHYSLGKFEMARYIYKNYNVNMNDINYFTFFPVKHDVHMLQYDEFKQWYIEHEILKSGWFTT
jgi:hypothetical protein